MQMHSCALARQLQSTRHALQSRIIGQLQLSNNNGSTSISALRPAISSHCCSIHTSHSAAATWSDKQLRSRKTVRFKHKSSRNNDNNQDDNDDNRNDNRRQPATRTHKEHKTFNSSNSATQSRSSSNTPSNSNASTAGKPLRRVISPEQVAKRKQLNTANRNTALEAEQAKVFLATAQRRIDEGKGTFQDLLAPANATSVPWSKPNSDKHTLPSNWEEIEKKKDELEHDVDEQIANDESEAAAENNNNAAPRTVARYSFESEAQQLHRSDRVEQYITTAPALQEFVKHLATQSIVGFDTEFITQGCYRASLQLIQIATLERVVAIDCQLITSPVEMSALLQALLTRDTVITHSCHMDMQVLYDLSVKLELEPQYRVPRCMFDTQVAAAYVGGHGSMVPYSKLLDALFAINMDKAEQLTDWKQRPLSQRQLHYALNDVRHLHAVHAVLTRELQQLQRLDWYRQEMRLYANARVFAPIDPIESWRTIRGAQRMSSMSRPLGALQQLACGLELHAQSKDTPLARIIRGDAMCAVAANQPQTTEQLRAIQGLSPFTIARLGIPILDLIRKGLAIPTHQLPWHRYSHQKAGRLRVGLHNLITSRVTARANELQISQHHLVPMQERYDLASVSREALQFVAALDWQREGAVDSETDLYALELQYKSQQHYESQVGDDLKSDSLVFRPSRHPTGLFGIYYDVLPWSLSTSPACQFNAPRGQLPNLSQEATLQQPWQAFTLQDEIDMLLRLKTLVGWRRQLIGNDLLRIAMGDSLTWNESTGSTDQAQTQMHKSSSSQSESQSEQSQQSQLLSSLSSDASIQDASARIAQCCASMSDAQRQEFASELAKFTKHVKSAAVQPSTTPAAPAAAEFTPDVMLAFMRSVNQQIANQKGDAQAEGTKPKRKSPVRKPRAPKQAEIAETT